MATPTKKRILVVEDDRFYANICKMKLTKEGFDVAVMSNGAWALKSLEKELPDLVLLDLVMPEMDGFEVLKQIKSSSRLKHIPVIVLTNLGQPEDIKKAKEYGADDYMVKTIISVQKMVEKIRSVIS